MRRYDSETAPRTAGKERQTRLKKGLSTRHGLAAFQPVTGWRMKFVSR